MSNRHEKYIRRCFELALKAGKDVKSNPNVGAVIVYNDQIIGEGYHTAFGCHHAEIEALNNVKTQDKVKLPESTLYISLEPCNIYKKTPPCTEAILKSGIRSVVISCLDPNPPMQGKSLEFLKSKGVSVTAGILEDQGRMVIAPFVANLAGKPYISLKYAQSSDNYIGKRDKRVKLSNGASDRKVHYLRAEHDAILIGYNTALIDNPELTTRLIPGDNPKRIILDRDLSLPRTHKLWSDEEPAVFISQKPYTEKSGTKSVLDAYPENGDMEELSMKLYKEFGICRLLVEGGQKTLNAFIEKDCWNRIYQLRVRKSMRSGVRAPFFRDPSSYLERFLDDQLYVYHNV